MFLAALMPFTINPNLFGPGLLRIVIAIAAFTFGAGGCPMKSPIAVKKFTTPIATPFVSVGRMIEHTGRLRLRNGQGSGMIRLVWKVSPPKGGAFRLGNTSPFVGSVRGGALPALSDQV